MLAPQRGVVCVPAHAAPDKIARWAAAGLGSQDIFRRALSRCPTEIVCGQGLPVKFTAGALPQGNGRIERRCHSECGLQLDLDRVRCAQRGLRQVFSGAAQRDKQVVVIGIYRRAAPKARYYLT